MALSQLDDSPFSSRNVLKLAKRLALVRNSVKSCASKCTYYNVAVIVPNLVYVFIIDNASTTNVIGVKIASPTFQTVVLIEH